MCLRDSTTSAYTQPNAYGKAYPCIDSKTNAKAKIN